MGKEIRSGNENMQEHLDRNKHLKKPKIWKKCSKYFETAVTLLKNKTYILTNFV